MVFIKIGLMTLAPGASVRWGVTGDGDFGAQYVGAHPETPGELVWTDESKVLDDNGKFYYMFTVRNPDPDCAVVFSMQGGGFV
jgi:hypothetical protein